MSLKLISFFILLLSLLIIVKTVHSFLKDRITIKTAGLWSGIWLAVGVFSVFPALLDFIMKISMMKDRMIFLFVVSIIILYVLSYNQSVAMKSLENKVSRLSQELSLLKFRIEENSLKKDE